MADVESRGGGDESTPLMAGKAAGRGGAAGGSRDAHLDNCKFWLMCAVVANHCFQDFFKSVLDREAGGRPWCQPDVARDPIGAYALARGAYMYLNLLGMPAFTLVSGICSRSLVRCATAGAGAGLATRSRRMVESLLVPYVIWQTVFLIYGTYGTGEFRPPPEHPVPFVSPVGVTWYLTALFAWRCSVQFIATLRNVVAVTFIVGLVVGFVDTPQTENGGLPFLDFQRAVAFAPMFYVGATALTEDVMSRLTSKGGAWVRYVGWAVTVATPAVFTAVLRWGGVCFDEAQRWAWTMVRYVLIFMFVWAIRLTACFVYRYGDGVMDEPVWAQMGFRLVFYVASIAVSLAFFAVVPVGTRWYSAYGSRTMYAYLLHLVVIRSYELCRDGTSLGDSMPLWVKASVSLVALPAVTSLGLMSARCKAVFSWVVEPKIGWLLFPDDYPQARVGST